MIRVTEIIKPSIEWTGLVLFKPFRIKKWLMLGLIATLAGQLAGGINFNSLINGTSERETAKNQQTQATSSSQLPEKEAASGTSSAVAEKPVPADSLNFLKSPLLLSLIVIILVIAVMFVIVMVWLSSRFKFIFLESVIKNDASLKAPFKKNRAIGNSLFLFSLAIGFFFLVLLAFILFLGFRALFTLGAFSNPSSVGILKIFFTCLPFVLTFFLIIFISALLQFIVEDFVLIIMFKESKTIMPSVRAACSLINANKLA
ncbi:MAG: hypothetical protein PHQ96_07790, partial [Candidatus Omnitrophica bacterium]|nr:hypothetical protein [Candidatus Omnitrophota bacterium]